MVILMYVCLVCWLFINSMCLPRMRGTSCEHSVTIIVPLRNEASNVEKLVRNLKQVQYTNMQCIFYDDQSTDDTLHLLQRSCLNWQQALIIQGNSLQSGWHGKSFACYEASKQATGQYLLFIDADVLLHQQTIQALIATCTRLKTDALTGFPRFINTNSASRLLTPLLHFFVHFHLPIVLANSQKMVAATAASGAFIAVKRHVYESIGGHAVVKGEIIEDVALFRALKRNGYRAHIAQISHLVRCQMYTSSKETWAGFQKNIFRAFNNNYLWATVMIGIYSCLFIAPFFFFPATMPICICIISLQVISDWRAQQLSLFSFLLPVAICLYCILLICTMFRKREILWKGRML